MKDQDGRSKSGSKERFNRQGLAIQISDHCWGFVNYHACRLFVINVNARLVKCCGWWVAVLCIVARFVISRSASSNLPTASNQLLSPALITLLPNKYLLLSLRYFQALSPASLTDHLPIQPQFPTSWSTFILVIGIVDSCLDKILQLTFDFEDSAEAAPLSVLTNLQIPSAGQTLKSDQIHFDWSIINHQFGRNKLTPCYPKSGDQTHNYDHVVSP